MSTEVKFPQERHEKEHLPAAQTHVHEFLGSTKFAGKITHNHRFAGVTSEAIPIPGGGHRHALLTNTDFAIGHLHELGAETGPAIDVGNGKHVHFVKALTTLNLGHTHEVVFATLIEDPTK
ncbi:MAG: YmaF family protein [Bacillota bacterium]